MKDSMKPAKSWTLIHWENFDYVWGCIFVFHSLSDWL